MSKTKVVLSTIGVLVLIVGVGVGVVLTKRNQDIRSRAAPATSLSFTPGTQSKSPGQTFTQNVTMDTGTNQVSGVQFDINYNPQIIEVVSVQRGGGISKLDQELTNIINNPAGKISYASYTLNSLNWVTGQNLIALTINAKIKDSAPNGSYQTSFAETTAVSASGEGQNVVTGKTSGTLTVTGTSGGSNPTSTPAGTITPASTTTPIPTLSSGTSIPTAQTTSLPIPETGTGWPTYLGAGVGVVVIILSVLIAL